MKCNELGLYIIRKWESLRLKAYQCSAGVWTIGWGHTKGVKQGDVCTIEQANIYFKEDVEEKELQINSLDLQLTDNEYSALVSFIFNIGIGNFNKSTMLRLLKQNKKIEASNEFQKWNKCKGAILNGLTNRRRDERNLFLS